VDRRILKNLDFTLLAVVGALVIIGVVMILSATHSSANITQTEQFQIIQRQLFAVLIGIVGGFLLLFMDYRISDRMSQLLYIGTALALILVIIPGVGTLRNSARMGLFGFQPSELAKVTIIITFGKYLAEKESLQSFYSFIIPTAFMGLPLILILLQPDMGTALVFIFVFFIMMYAAGAPGWKLLVIIGIGISIVGLLFLGNHFFGTPLPIKGYQLDRLTSFIDPDRDPKGSGWNVRQAVIAVGSGQFFGKGLFRGTQGRLGYLPENYTDFIFAVLCEETGFIGGFIVLILYFTLIWRGIRIALQARDKTGSMIAIGIVSVFLFHVMENVGMNMGVMPITGIPLPFITYGGSSMMANLFSVSLLSSIWARHQKIMF
jgi:rod shape determining protein RodA